MTAKISPLIFCVTISVLVAQFSVCQVYSDVSRTSGVHAGDWATYDCAFTYSTNDPDPPIPHPLDIEHCKVEVQSVDGTIIRFALVLHLRNGTEISDFVSTDVSYHDFTFNDGNDCAISNCLFFFAANLNAGDTLHIDPSSPVVDSTIIRTYAGVEMETNHVRIDSFAEFLPDYTISVQDGYIWDRATGICDELERTVHTVNWWWPHYTTHLSIWLRIRETNLYYPSASADINKDNKIDGKDVAIVTKSFSSHPEHPNWNNGVADVDHDDKVDGRDVAIVAKYFGSICRT